MGSRSRVGGRIATILIVVALAIIVGGIYPKPILQIAGPALEDLLAQVKDFN